MKPNAYQPSPCHPSKILPDLLSNLPALKYVTVCYNVIPDSMLLFNYLNPNSKYAERLRSTPTNHTAIHLF